ncbi:MAG: Hsp20/alpha crystallin family protein [Bacteroidia bacterium]|nr:Hsp20/alpha crystallin family protein [Bacteroidia bacterium]HQV00788.1 Hsp20/alpha crystallin family protein [Bacteroidia bacterium]
MTLLKFNNNLAKHFDARPVFNELYNELFENFGPMHKMHTVPTVNISESDDKFNIALAAPGLNKEDFNVNVQQGVLTISAEQKSEDKEGTAKFTRREYSYTKFSRSFTLPETVKADNISATYLNGVLSLDIPKIESEILKNRSNPLEIKIS